MSGPGGAGKGTVAARLVQRDPTLWLSRSWTTRDRRDGESEDAYVFVDRAAFDERISSGGFLEWAEFLGNRYGTPVPECPPGRDVLLEIDVQGAAQVKQRCPGAVVVLLLPPSSEDQEMRLRTRGDPDEHVRMRLAKAAEEVGAARRLADFVVVNRDVDRAVDELEAIVLSYRRAARADPGGDTRRGS
ncbi:MAG: guanylate kinase [Acidimicrobiales bacterium]